MTEGKWSVFGASEEEQMVEEALGAADAGHAGHWPTVAGILALEVRRLREVQNRVRGYVTAGLGRSWNETKEDLTKILDGD